MNAVTFNANDWTGDEITVEYTDDGRFEMAGYTFWLGEFVEVFRGAGYRQLFGSDWGDDVLTSLQFESDDMETAVRAAGRWIRNHV